MKKNTRYRLPKGFVSLTAVAAITSVSALAVYMFTARTNWPNAAKTIVAAENVLGAPASLALGFNNAEQVESVGTGSDTNMVAIADGNKIVMLTRSGVGTVKKTVTVTEGVPTLPAMASDGSVIAVGWSERTSAGTVVKVAVSRNSGSTFTELTTVGTGTGLSLAAADGTVTAVWHDGDETVSHIRLSQLNGTTWSAPMTVDVSPKAALWASVGVASNVMVVSWRDNRAGDFMVWQRRSLDGGSTWQSEQQLSTRVSGDPDVCVTTTGDVWVAHHGAGKISLLHSQDNGATFGSSVTVGDGYFAHLSCTDRVVTVGWEQTTGPTTATDKAAGYAFYKDDGTLLTSGAITDGSIAATTAYVSANSRVAEILWVKTDSALTGTLRHQTYSLY